ncbi:ComEA family DNA-binding protein [Marinomonas ostreistagni]|nr:ComEA family DNA-binding protein [Marinomonas ostreistagni]
MFHCLKKLFVWTVLVVPLFALAAEPLDINTATANQLALALSGVGQSKAEAIIAYREQNGPFASIDDLTNVKGIGPALLDKNRIVIQAKPEK